MEDNLREEPSDPTIVKRLKNIPPFDEEEETPTPEVVETPEEEPAPVPEVKPEVKPETEEERKKRTADEFEKLKQHNDQLKRDLEAAKAKVPEKNALDALYPEPKYPESPVTNVLPTTQQFPSLTPKEIKDTFANLTDDQGYVDTGLLKETLANLQRGKEEAERRAREAEDRSKRVERRQDDFERKQVMKLVHDAFPKLNPDNALSDDPNTKFDPDFYEGFQGEIMRQWSVTGTADPMLVAEKINKRLYGATMTKADKEKADQAELAKRNINATNAKPVSTADNYKDHDALVVDTRKGKTSAILERLNRIGQ